MTFSISAKIQDSGQNYENSIFSIGTISKVSSTQRVQTLLKITLSPRVFEINDIFNFRPNSRWQPKSRSQDKCVFAFYAEIQDGRQNGGKAIFVKCHQYTLQIPCGLKIPSKSLISNRFQEKWVIAFYAEIYDGSKKMAGK